MSSIVSRRPPVSGSTSHSNERRWISMRFGTSRTFSRRAKLRRVRGASRAGTTATPRGSRRAIGRGALARGAEARPANLAQAEADPQIQGQSTLTDPVRAPAYVARAHVVDGYDYRSTARSVAARGDSRQT